MCLQVKKAGPGIRDRSLNPDFIIYPFINLPGYWLCKFTGRLQTLSYCLSSQLCNRDNDLWLTVNPNWVLSTQAVHLRKWRSNPGLNGRRKKPRKQAGGSGFGSHPLSAGPRNTCLISMIQTSCAQNQNQNGIPGESRTPRTILSTQ